VVLHHIPAAEDAARTGYYPFFGEEITMIRTISSIAFIALLGLVGCSGEKAASTSASATAKPTPDHGHKPGQHGGVIVDIGADNYHAEPVFEKGGLLRLHMLGQDETKVLEVDAQALEAHVKGPGDSDPEPIVLRPDPRPDDTKGKTSRFVAQLPRALIGQKVQVTITSIRIGDERFRVSFSSAPEKDDHGMPAKVANEDERKLYLTPAGKYTAEDIKANGNKTRRKCSRA